MRNQLALKRRQFLVATAAVGGGMALGVHLPSRKAAAQAAAGYAVNPKPWLPPVEGGVELSPWVVIGADNSVTIMVNQQEMGQGVFTSNPMMICEELECDWSKVRAVYADPNRHFRENKVYGRMATNASASVRTGREGYQQVGASARERLKLAAAQQWNAPVAEVEAKNSTLTHRPSGRTLTYGQVAARAATVKLDKEPAIKAPDKYSTIIGKHVKMLDTELKVYAQATFGIDIRFPDMLYAAVKAPPTYGGKLKSFNFDAIKGRPGVHSAVALDKLPNANANGIAVVADSWWRAKTALDVMPVEWDLGPNASLGTKDLVAEFTRLLNQPGAIVSDQGNVETALRGAGKSVEAVYETPFQAHSTMEPLNCTARVTADRAEVWGGNQGPDGTLQTTATLTGLPLDKVNVYTTFLGGGFGGRGSRGETEQAVTIAKTLNGRPVKLLWTREEDTRRDNNYHPMGMSRFRALLGADGMPVALHMKVVGAKFPPPLADFGPNKVKVDPQHIRGLASIPYGAPNWRLEGHFPATFVPTAYWRSTGSHLNVFYRECFVDEMALAAGKDPVDYRRALINAASPGQFEDNSKADWLLTLNTAAQKSGWGKTLPKGTGMGIAIDDRQSVPPRGIALAGAVATVSVSRSGFLTVDKMDIVHDEGHAIINPEAADRQMRGQIPWGMGAAINHGITVRNGRVVETNFDDYPMPRISEFPKDVAIHYIKTKRWISGIGEEVVPVIAPAICNAVFAATGKRVRSLPLKEHDLSWT